MKLIVEQNFNVRTLLEGEGDSKNVFIEGIFMQSEKANRNGRIYPSKILENETKRYIREFVKTNRALGELNHPESPVVDPAKASHLITDLRLEGNNVIGKAKVLNTPMGNVVRGLLEGGVQLGVSSRGMGSLKTLSNGINEVQDDYVLSTIDIVHDPSAPEAFVNGIMEGVEWVFENGILKAHDADYYRKTVENTKDELKEHAKLEAFQDFLNKIKKGS